MPAYQRALPAFDRLEAQVLGISVDSVPCNTAWAESLGGLDYPLLSDFWPHGQVTARYGLLNPEGFAERAVVVVDKAGVVRHIAVHEPRQYPDPEAVLAVLQRLTGILEV